VPALVEQPAPVNHRLLLLNWSRLSRSGPAFLWYLAFPFTLLNLARAMEPVESGPRWVHRMSVRLVSGILSAATTIWIIAITERLFTAVDLPVAMEGSRPHIAALVAALSLCVPMLYRARCRPESEGHRTSAVLHAVIVLAVTLATVFLTPAHIEIDKTSRFSLFTVRAPSDAQLDQLSQAFATQGSATAESIAGPYLWPEWLDIIAVASYGSLMVAAAMAILLTLVPLRSQTPIPSLASGLVLILSAALLNLLASSVYIGSQKIAASGWAMRWIPFLGGPDLPHPPTSIVIGRLGDSFATSIVAGVSATGLAIFLIALLCVLRPRRRQWKRLSKPRLAFGLWAHNTVEHLGEKLTVILIVFALATPILIWGVQSILWTYIDAFRVVNANGMESPVWPTMYARVSYGISLLGLGVFFTIKNVHRLQALRDTLALISDIAGFWGISVHPLGARTYRPDAVAGVRDAITKSDPGEVVLVGHSQGSVICAWALWEAAGHQEFSQEPTPRKPSFITCGSPLHSLYEILFPRVFDQELFLRVRRGSSQWTNFWRQTDPIATAIPFAGIENVQIEDPLQSDRDALVHSDYWIDPQQRAKVAEFLTTHRLHERAED